MVCEGSSSSVGERRAVELLFDRAGFADDFDRLPLNIEGRATCLSNAARALGFEGKGVCELPREDAEVRVAEVAPSSEEPESCDEGNEGGEREAERSPKNIIVRLKDC
jgi:hypothetical protein